MERKAHDESLWIKKKARECQKKKVGKRYARETNGKQQQAGQSKRKQEKAIASKQK